MSTPWTSALPAGAASQLDPRRALPSRSAGGPRDTPQAPRWHSDCFIDAASRRSPGQGGIRQADLRADRTESGILLDNAGRTGVFFSPSEACRRIVNSEEYQAQLAIASWFDGPPAGGRRTLKS